MHLSLPAVDAAIQLVQKETVPAPLLLEAFQTAASGRQERLVSRRVLKAGVRLRAGARQCPPNR